VWSKAGKFVEGLHTVGDIITKISVNYVIKLHVALLFTYLFLWVYYICGYKCLYSYGYCMYMLHVCVYYYFSMNLCNYIMHLSIYVLYIKFCNSSMCICFNCMKFKKFMWHSSVGCWVCYIMFRREKKIILWSSMARHGWSGMLHFISMKFIKIINIH
jgi:hypothetical protein